MPTKIASAVVGASVLAVVLAGCGAEQKTALPEYQPSDSPSASPTASAPAGSAAPAFRVPSPGDPLGEDVAARPADAETAAGATAFATWMLSLLLHTPRESAATARWTSAAAPTCTPCREAASAWTSQTDKGQVFAYAKTPTFDRIAVKAQPQGSGWFTQLDARVPRATLRQGDSVLQSTRATGLSYTFTLRWSDDAWELADFHVLG